VNLRVTLSKDPPGMNDKNPGLISRGSCCSYLTRQRSAIRRVVRNGRLVAVVDVTVMSPRAPIVYTRPEENETAVSVMTFAVPPV
jgi:hypothetical protein